MHLELWQWAVVGAGAFLAGLSKTGITGLGILAVAIFALILPPRESVGIVLLILISADIVAVAAYRREANWRQLLRLFPWTAVGVVLGYLAFGRIDGGQLGRLIGAILVVLVALHLWRKYGARATASDAPRARWLAPLVGATAGFTTMVANAAGPVMVIYLLAMNLPKMEFIGTTAWFFLSVNLFKVPFSYALGLIDAGSLLTVLPLVPFAIAGAVFGRLIIAHINQRLFELVALLLALAAGIRLLF
jgi:uncharacterized membrane protein YfcA